MIIDSSGEHTDSSQGFFWYECDGGKQVWIGPRFGRKPSDPMRAVSICCLRTPNEVCCGRTRGR